MRYEDTEFDPATDADREAAAREAELARKIRREVLRVQRGEADDDLRADREAEQEQRAEQERAARMERRRKSSFLWLLFSGNILVRESLSGYYRYLIYMAVTFFVSIFVMFTALHLDMKYTRLEREVQAPARTFRTLAGAEFPFDDPFGRRARARGARHSVVRSGRSGRNHRRVTMPQPKENSPIKRDILFRVHLLYAAFVLIAALVFARLIWVQALLVGGGLQRRTFGGADLHRRDHSRTARQYPDARRRAAGHVALPLSGRNGLRQPGVRLAPHVP